MMTTLESSSHFAYEGDTDAEADHHHHEDEHEHEREVETGKNVPYVA